MGASSNAVAKKERVWVAVRIRPLLELEQLARERTAWKAVGSNNLQHVDLEKPAAQCTSYQYNRVFPDSSTSAQVYKEAAAGLVAASMQGYNSTIFAYGQTGSGKTYTMQSIMAAAAQDMFQAISQEPGREFIIRMAAVEIYNEVVRDLLRDNSPGLKLLDDPLKGTVAEGLSEAGVQSEQHLQQLLAEVEARRQVSVAATCKHTAAQLQGMQGCIHQQKICCRPQTQAVAYMCKDPAARHAAAEKAEA
jgi:centromeric protein E